MKYSRHSKNNMRLYSIKEDEVIQAINYPDNYIEEEEKTIVLKHFGRAFFKLSVESRIQSRKE